MSDESRFRSPGAHGQPQAQPVAASSRVRRTEDPLAELARLIGQEDPFADFVAHRPADARSAGNLAIQRRPRAPEGRGYDGRPADRGAERRRPLPRTPEPASEYEIQQVEEAPRSNGRGAYAYGGTRVPRVDAVPAPPPRSYREETTRASARPEPIARDAEPYHEHETPTRTLRRSSVHAPQADDAAYDQYDADYDPDYADDAYLPAHGDEFYDEAPRRSLKPWLLAGVAVVGLVVVGASGLFAYRAIFGVTSNSTPPVTIRPEAGPTKVVPGPATKSADTGGNKQIYDRIGGEPPPGGERIVSREEKPIEQNAAPAATPSRMPAGTVAAAPPSAIAPAPVQANPPPPPSAFSTEPRRVRTVTVRADGTVVNEPSRPAPAAPAPRANTAAAPAGGSTSASAPLALNNAPGGVALPPARPATSAAPQPSENPWASVSNSGQLSAPTPTTQAALAPQPTPGAVPQNPPPIVAVNTPPPAGSYVVQVAAQKTEAEAQATWQQLQQRYASILGGQQASIRRVDLGERGVFYRAQVGPFGSRSQASEVCQSLKAAGGECVIQRN